MGSNTKDSFVEWELIKNVQFDGVESDTSDSLVEQEVMQSIVDGMGRHIRSRLMEWDEIYRTG